MDSRIRTAATEGDYHEERIIREMEAIGWNFASYQEAVEIEVIPGVWVRGHSDGLAKYQPEYDEMVNSDLAPFPFYGDTHYLIEIKSKSKDQYKKWMASHFHGNRPHRFQLIAYHEAKRRKLGLDFLPIFYVVKDRNLGTLDVQTLDKPPGLWGEVAARVVQIERLAKDVQLPDCDRSDWFICEYKHLCNYGQSGEELFPGDAANDRFTVEQMQELAMLGEKHVVLSERIREGEAAQKDRAMVNERIVEMLGRQKKGNKVEVAGMEIAIRGRTKKITDYDRMYADMREAGLNPDSYVRDALDDEEARWAQVKILED